jgi:hypothetical protein
LLNVDEHASTSKIAPAGITSGIAKESAASPVEAPPSTMVASTGWCLLRQPSTTVIFDQLVPVEAAYRLDGVDRFVSVDAPLDQGDLDETAGRPCPARQRRP